MVSHALALTLMKPLSLTYPNLSAILLLFSFVLSIIFCSRIRSNIHFESLLGKDQVISIKNDPEKTIIYDEIIVPWLSQHLPIDYLNNFHLEDINKLNNFSSFSPQVPRLFKDKKLLFELAELLLTKNLVELAVEVIRRLRTAIFYSSTYSLLVESLNRPDKNLLVFHKILKLWFPSAVDLVSLIQNLIKLRIGEDSILELIDLVWDQIWEAHTSTRNSLNHDFASILLAAMQNHYVFIFEEILEKVPGLIEFINLGMNHGGTILHMLSQLSSVEGLNRLPLYKISADGESIICIKNRWIHRREAAIFSGTHLNRSYPTSNQDLLAAMIRHGADINAIDDRGITPLTAAIISKNAPIVKVFLEAPPEYGLKCGKYGLRIVLNSNYSKQVEEVLMQHFGEDF